MTIYRDRFDIRPAELADVPGIEALAASVLLPEDTGDAAALRRVLWEDAQEQTPVRLVAVEADRIVGAAFGYRDIDEGEARGNILLVAVAEDRRRDGVGSALVSALESQFASAGAATLIAGGSQPFFWWPGIDLRYGSALKMFRALGYEQDDEVANMTVDLLTANLSDDAATEILVRRLDPSEYDSFHAWMLEEWEDMWAGEISRVVDRNPVSCWVAVHEGRYIAFAGYDTNRRGWFGPMGSTEAARGRGIGRALLRRCLSDMKSRGETSCEICWIGPEGFYRDAVGAQIGRRFSQLSKTLP